MGCNTSEPNVAGSVDFANRSPSQDCINDDKKTKLKKIIQKDNHTELALFLADKFVPLNAQISEPGQKWMLTHICCRFDAFNCLDYLLKHQFIESPVKYIDYVNASNIDGLTCLHLCGIWKAEKSFNVLYFYGGLHLTATDKNRKTPLEMAIQNKCKKIVEILQNHRDQGISFTLVETQKLTKGSLLTQDSNKNKAAQDAIFKNNQALMQNSQSQQIKKLKQQKRKLQDQSKKIMQQKLDKEYQIQKQKAQLAKSLGTNSQVKAEAIKQNQEIKKKIQQSLKAEREKFKLQLQKKQEELRKVKDEMRILQQKKVDSQKIQAQKITENFSIKNQKEIKDMIQDKNKTVDKLKLQRQTQEQKTQKEQEKINKNKGKALNLDSLRKVFKNINQKLSPELQRKYSEALQNGQFFDQQFPAVESSIGNREDQNFANFNSTVVWLRPHDIFPQVEQFVLFEGIDPNDIQQGQLGVCYMLATLSSLALYPEQIQKLFIYADTNVGFYVIKLFINGIPKFIAIDDKIPCNKSTYAPFFTRPVGNQLWVMLMQKVWAKAIGSYLSAQGMPIDEMMEDLSGAPSFGGPFADNQETGQSITTQIQTVVDYCNQGFNTVIGSYSDAPQGIVSGHAYTLLQCLVVNETNVFKIRNPWGGTQWLGQYSQGSQLMTPQVIQQLGYTNQQDGVFFMSQSQLTSCFEDYAVNINMGIYAYNYREFSSKFNEDKFFKFKITEKCSVNVRITQKFDRMLRDKNYQYAPLVFEVGHIKSQKQVIFIDEGDKNTTYGGKSVHGFNNICQELQPGDYYVRVRMMWPNPQQYNAAVLIVYASKTVKIQQLQPEIGRKYLNLMLVNHLKSQDDIQYQDSQDGQGRFKLCLMKGQYVFLLQTQNNNKYKPTVSIPQSQNLQPDFGKIDSYAAQGIVTKKDPCVVTFSYINLVQQALAYGYDIKFNKA